MSAGYSITTSANGYGLWSAVVTPSTPIAAHDERGKRNAILAGKRAIRREVAAREQKTWESAAEAYERCTFGWADVHWDCSSFGPDDYPQSGIDRTRLARVTVSER